MKKMLTFLSSIALISTAGLAVVSCDNGNDIIQGTGVNIDLTFDVSDIEGARFIFLSEGNEHWTLESTDENKETIEKITYKDEISSKNIAEKTLGDYLVYNKDLFSMEYTTTPGLGVMPQGFFGVKASEENKEFYSFNESFSGNPMSVGVSFILLSQFNSYTFQLTTWG